MTSLVPRLWSELSEWFDQDGGLRGTGLIRLEDRVTDTEYMVVALSCLGWIPRRTCRSACPMAC
jgi:hypothetical protein